MEQKLSKRLWLSFIVLGLTGQFAWTIENMYFNVFLYNTVSTDSSYIAAMLAASGIVATVTALVIGALSDKIGKRKAFICVGYILWGISIIAFAFIKKDNVSKLFPAANAVALTAVTVVVMDCIMTFFGSTANDAALNAFITDNTGTKNRGRVEAVLSTLPLISMLVIFGLFDGMTQKGEWSKFFIIFGLLAAAVGVAAIFLLPREIPKPNKESYFKNILYGFRPSVIKDNPLLYLALITFCLFCIAMQVFFPYLIIYMQNYLKIDNYAIVLGVVLIIASAISVLSGKLIDKVGKLTFVLPALGVYALGLVGMFFARSFVGVIITGTVMMSGYMLVNAALCGTIRDYTPSDRAGLLQGIRMIFQVLIPMVVGPYIGNAIIKNSDSTYIELGVVKNVPTPGIFLGAAITLAVTFIPLIILRKRASK